MAQWRESARQPKLFMLDAYVLPFILLWSVWTSWPTFYLMIALIATMGVLAQFGYTPVVALLALRRLLVSSLAGEARPVRSARREHRRMKGPDE